MGRFVADIIRKNPFADGFDRSAPAFTYADKGTLATIGRSRAGVDGK